MSTPYSARKRTRIATEENIPAPSTQKHARISTELRSEHRSRSDYEASETNVYSVRPQRIRFSVNDRDSDSSEIDALTVLIQQKWKVYKVSPLNNFSYSARRMKQYGRRLREGLASLETDSAEYEYDAKFDTEDGLAKTPHDNEAIKIIVNLIKHDGEENVYSRLYTGYLISRGSPEPMYEESVVHLPILLCAGLARPLRSVHDLLQKFFDCSISQLQLPQEDLHWICALIADRDNNSNVQMQFRFPQLPVKNNLIFKMPCRMLSMLWKSVHDSASENVTDKEIKKFHDVLSRHLTYLTDSNISYGQLVKVSVPALSVTVDCTIAAKSCELMNTVLRILYETATIINTSAPSTGFVRSIQPA